MTKSICVLGSTGSIGTQTLEVAKTLGLRVVGLAGGRNEALLKQQTEEWRPLRTALGYGTALLGLAAMPEADIIVNAVSGMAGIRVSFAAIQAGKALALANKESVVAAGGLLTRLAERTGARILPVDSEHSAIWQCLQGVGEKTVEKLIITASGGAFRAEADLSAVTPEEALRHPTWQMGRKVTIDAATMMNKGFEMIEARRLFRVPMDKIQVVIHPQSVAHSLVQFSDGAVLAQMAVADMRLPIQYALTHPRRVDSALPRLDLVQLGSLTFEAPDETRFPCLRLAREADAAGGSYPAVLVGADEAAVALFLNGKIGFMDIPRLIEGAASAYTGARATDLDGVLAAVQFGYEFVNKEAG